MSLLRDRVNAGAGVDVLVLLADVVLDADGGVLLLLGAGAALADAADDEVGVAVVVEGNAVAVAARVVDDAVHVGHVHVVGPLLEQVAHVDHVRPLDRRRRVPVLGLVVPDLEARHVALQEEGDDAKVAVGADACVGFLVSVSSGGWA